MNKLFQFRQKELPVFLYSSFSFFFILCSYYILRPIRDELGIQTGTNTLPWLFSATLIAIILLNFPFSWLTQKLGRRSLLRFLFRFFTINLILFAVCFRSFPDFVWTGRIFFVWVSVFNLFVVSIFWVLLVDLFKEEEGKRLFGMISAGGSLGAIAGSLIAVFTAEHLPHYAMILISTFFLEAATQTGFRMYDTDFGQGASSGELDQTVLDNGSLFSGLKGLFQSPYLLNSAAYIFIYTITSSFLYFQQISIFETAFSSSGERTAVLAKMDLTVNAATLFLQVFLTARIIHWIGVTGSLIVLPFLGLLGFGFLSFYPSVIFLICFQILRRICQFAFAKPTREILFTLVSKEDKFKAKNFMDTALYRLGDQCGAWMQTLFGWIGMNSMQISMLGVFVSALWLWNSVWLGKKEKVLSSEYKEEP